MAIVICRHGQTVYNKEDRFQGVSNSPLTDKGVEQTKKLRDFIEKSFDIKLFYISPAPRVLQTFKILNTNLQKPAIIDYRLQEVCYGSWEGKHRNDIEKTLLEQREKNRFKFKHPGTYQGRKGGSYQELYCTVKPLFMEIENSRQDICIIAHHGIMIAAYKYFFKPENDALNELRISNNQVIVIQNHNPSLITI